MFTQLISSKHHNKSWFKEKPKLDLKVLETVSLRAGYLYGEVLLITPFLLCAYSANIIHGGRRAQGLLIKTLILLGGRHFRDLILVISKSVTVWIVWGCNLVCVKHYSQIHLPHPFSVHSVSHHSVNHEFLKWWRNLISFPVTSTETDTGVD